MNAVPYRPWLRRLLWGMASLVAIALALVSLAVAAGLLVLGGLVFLVSNLLGRTASRARASGGSVIDGEYTVVQTHLTRIGAEPPRAP